MVIIDFFDGLEVDDTFELGLLLVWWEEREADQLEGCVCVYTGVIGP